MQISLPILMLICLPLAFRGQTTFPYGLNKAKVDIIFNDMLWAMSQADPAYAANKNNPKLPFGMTVATLTTLYTNLVNSLYSTQAGTNKTLPGLNYQLPLPPAPVTPTPVTSMSAMAKLISDKLNQHRLKETALRLKALTWSDAVATKAFKHSTYMALKGAISHDNFTERANGYMGANENVAYFSGSIVSDEVGAEKFITMWKNSPGHNTNMLAGNVDTTGVAVYLDAAKKAYYATMLNVKTKA